MALKFEKNRPDFLKFAVYGTPINQRPLQIPYREDVKQFVPREYLKRCAYIRPQKKRASGINRMRVGQTWALPLGAGFGRKLGDR
jgi:hypothetical protein